MIEELISCFRYNLLLGKAPYATSNLENARSRIEEIEYHIPSGSMSTSAKALIEKLLQSDPAKRPSMQQVLKDEFFSSG